MQLEEKKILSNILTAIDSIEELERELNAMLERYS